MSFITWPAGAKVTTPTTNKEFALGTIAIGNNGTRWMYVQASSAISQYYVGAVTESFTMAPATAALAGEGHIPAFPQVAFGANEYGWVPIAGTSDLKVRTGAAVTKDAALYVGSSGASAGAVVSNSTSGVLLNGVVTVATAASAGVYPGIIATNPWFTP